MFTNMFLSHSVVQFTPLIKQLYLPEKLIWQKYSVESHLTQPDSYFYDHLFAFY